jgi:heme/copper-type cytochrome/quinol oxidase subunit 4
MDPFEQVWETSRHNSWSWGYPTALVLGVVVLIALSLIRKAALRRPLKAVAILAFAFVATEFSAREIHEKMATSWRMG